MEMASRRMRRRGRSLGAGNEKGLSCTTRGSAEGVRDVRGLRQSVMPRADGGGVRTGRPVRSWACAIPAATSVQSPAQTGSAVHRRSSPDGRATLFRFCRRRWLCLHSRNHVGQIGPLWFHFCRQSRPCLQKRKSAGSRAKPNRRVSVETRVPHGSSRNAATPPSRVGAFGRLACSHAYTLCRRAHCHSVAVHTFSAMADEVARRVLLYHLGGDLLQPSERLRVEQ